MNEFAVEKLRKNVKKNTVMEKLSIHQIKSISLFSTFPARIYVHNQAHVCK